MGVVYFIANQLILQKFNSNSIPDKSINFLYLHTCMKKLIYVVTLNKPFVIDCQSNDDWMTCNKLIRKTSWITDTSFNDFVQV